MFGRRRRKNIIRRKKETQDIDPDEIFLDSSNLPEFNKDQFEGRIEKPISKKVLYGVLGFFLIVVMIYLGRVSYLQVVEGKYYQERSQNNRFEKVLLFSERGIITDRNGEELAWNEINLSDPDFSKRVYLEDDGFAHLLGFVDYPSKDSKGNYYEEKIIGKSGVENHFQEYLSGNTGRLIKEVDALGKIHSENFTERVEDGKDLTLSIDAGVQGMLFKYIKERAIDSGFLGGAGVIMNVHTGEILALTNFPEFDPNVLTEGSDSKIINSYNQDPNKPFLNRAVAGLYTPGSIVKPFIGLSALEENIIDPQKEILSTGSISIPNPYFPDKSSVFKDWKAHGWVDMREALAVSSNVYFYEIGGGFKDQVGLGIEKIKEYMNEFGFGNNIDINFGETEQGVVPGPSWKEENFTDGTWRIGDTYNTSIGQYGFQVTPLQMARAVSLIANGGKPLKPTVMKRDSGIVEKTLDISGENMQVIREGMRMAVTEGTASALDTPIVEIAAKTGTAEVGTQKRLVNSWAVGYWPYENPKFAFAVVMEKGPVSNLVGSVWVIRRLIEEMFANSPEYLK